ncbi:MAG: four helix bundle protein [bacterium]|nr:four helix bundle protein [bacterium]
MFHKVSRLYRAVHERVSRFPKASRYSLGAHIEKSVLEILELLYLAQSKRGPSRLLILNKADITLKMLMAHLRLAHETRCVNDAGFSELAERTIEIGRMIGGWIRATKTP